ncbi:hypothetical protein [Erythrobacter sp.]|uniref:hypothetical protein n=1 Tax=Erythrobacter sp. TaxID=1042 RepID=UPI002EAA3210|nr:hypothetical protein [Erythrobacter sp.]
MAARSTRRDAEPRFTKARQTQFLEHLAQSSNVRKSAAKMRIAPSTAYNLRRKDAEFARRWLAALYEGYLHLELEVVRRLRDGDMQTEGANRYDFANAIRLLSAHRDTAARAQAQQRNVSAAEVRASIDSKVEAIRRQVRQTKERQGEAK